jgi:uncharacterized cupin superfamily protein
VVASPGHTRQFTFPDGSHREVSELPSMFVGRGTYLAGWRWSKHVGASTGREADRHIGYVLSGRLRIRAANGQVKTVGPGDAFEVGPGHDAWVLGDEPCVALDFEAR